METTAEQQKAVREYFWDNDIQTITTAIMDGTLPDNLDRDLVMRKYAEYVKPHMPPKSDSKPCLGWGGEKICGERTAHYASKMEEYLNDYGMDCKGFVAYVLAKYHRTIQQSFMSLVMTAIREYAEVPDSRTDPRNAEAVRVARILAKALDEAGYGRGLRMI